MITLAGCLAGCEKEVKPLRVLIDIAGSPVDASDGTIQTYAENFIGFAKMAGACEDIELEIVPAGGSERSSKLTRIRTEMMAGEGPDLFIVRTNEGSDSSTWRVVNESLFLMPEKSMALGLFYPLEDLIENAQFMEWDKLTPVIMDARKSEEYGQVILPLAYTFNTTLYLKEDAEHTPSKEITWDDMVSDNGIMQAAAAVSENFSFDIIADSFGALADYSNKQLLFTEDELLERINELLDLQEKHQQGFDVPDYFQSPMCPNIEISNWGMANDGYKDVIPGLVNDFGERTDKALTMVPVYSDDGGVTATVYSFAAINANSKRAEDAFFLLDLLFSEEYQQSNSFYNWFTMEGGCLPVYEGLMTEETSLSAPYREWSMTDENYETFTKVRDSITHVNFSGTIRMELDDLARVIILNVKGAGDNMEEEIHTTYTRMKRELSE